MSENPPNEDHVVFTWGQEGDALCVQCTYKDARVHIDFTDDGAEGTRAMQRAVSTWPVVLKAIRQEQMIRKETDEIDGDLLSLLDDDGDDDA